MTSRIYDTAVRAKCRDEMSAPTEGNAAAKLGQEQDPGSLAEEMLRYKRKEPNEPNYTHDQHSNKFGSMHCTIWKVGLLLRRPEFSFPLLPASQGAVSERTVQGHIRESKGALLHSAGPDDAVAEERLAG